MELAKRKYKKHEVKLMLDAYRTEYQKIISEQKALISQLNNRISLLTEQLDSMFCKEKNIVSALENAEDKAMDIKNQAISEYALEVERIKNFAVRWNSYFIALKEQYPLSKKVERAIKIKDKALNADNTAEPKDLVEELDLMLDGMDKDTVKEINNDNFNPKQKIMEYISATGNNGFNLEDVLNPGELELGGICKELGLTDENE